MLTFQAATDPSANQRLAPSANSTPPSVRHTFHCPLMDEYSGQAALVSSDWSGNVESPSPTWNNLLTPALSLQSSQMTKEREGKLTLTFDSPDGEDLEMQAAQQFTRDFLCQVLEEEEENPGSGQPGGQPGGRPSSQSLSSILGLGAPHPGPPGGAGE